MRLSGAFQNQLRWSLKDRIKQGRISLEAALEDPIARSFDVAGLVLLAAIAQCCQHGHDGDDAATATITVCQDLPIALRVCELTAGQRRALLSAFRRVHAAAPLPR